jgi:hypothetical protein
MFTVLEQACTCKLKFKLQEGAHSFAKHLRADLQRIGGESSAQPGEGF